MIDDLYPLIIDVFQVALQTHFHTSSSKNLPFVHPPRVGGLEHFFHILGIIPADFHIFQSG